MSEPRIIKKYPNRRLYDTAISSYITLEDVKQLVLERVVFHVIDARTNTDITRGILLQIISEQEEQGNPIFTTDVLAHIIRFYGDTLQGMMGNYLEKSLQAFVDQQHLFREQMRTFMGKNPLAMMTELVEHNLSLWKSVNERLQKPYPGDPLINPFQSVMPDGEPSPEPAVDATAPSAARPAASKADPPPVDSPAPTAEREKPVRERKARKDKDS
ncbi:MAG TPA: polyhydroxyalkanoate synthesis repressor PhaR [Candidatus Competibacteraceae bacterium]|nr:MAG: polyhydroxyalkanoate synthesis repressor PhaR [Candidatus Competibacteraceae bacterium]HOB61526.1 polyhydroxyalkanoate synthesis repressor PhaR [Candidatus Competibacteraceae bacterium]HQA25013.1 polyhydroxyalkanoate synthesis repressor PhaR [Candidatus Competibacteraceae bacterium]HQD55968.1 polyhydroxyalkanoate synthesis repressor PhaR [Candidatus Competibacteraceae bacterium]